ncbi:MAG: DUF4153 domain-containing protein [Ruminococcaceae bacterium]|nr:DUF4153 domain-containing protein [Oscillospiraceae bacterium]
MKLRQFFTNFFNGVKNGISRYFIAFICTVLLFLTAAYEILFETYADDVIIPLCMAFGLTALFSVLLKSVQEYLFEKLSILIQAIVCTLAAILSFILIHTYYQSLYTAMAYAGVMIALVCFIFFVLMRGEHRESVFAKLIAASVFSSAVCSVLSGGLSTCIGAFQALLFNFDNIYKVYAIVLLFVWTIGYPNIFLSFIPKKDTPSSQSKIFKTFVLYAGLPLYILLIAILLVYLAKIVVTWHMPVGEINWFASFASLFFIFFVMSVQQYKEKLATLFVRYGGYFLIPVLIMQAIAVFERINAYGLTTPRTISLVLIVISILFIGATIIKPKHINKIALASGIIVLLVTVTPFNVIDMPVASQTAILKNALLKNDMIKDGIVVPNDNVSEEDQETIRSSYHYLRYSAKKTPDFIPDSNKEFSEIFGFERYANNNFSTFQYCSYETKKTVDISAYDQMIKMNSNDVLSLEHNGQQYEINVEELAQELYNQYGANQHEMELYKVNENVSLYFLHFSVELENDVVSYCNFNGYVFLKN